MAALVFDLLRHFRLLLWNGLTEFNEPWQEARSQRPLPSLCVFRADRKNKMAALASDWLWHFRILIWNSWMEFNKTWQDTRSQCPLPSVFFRTDRKNKMAALASDGLETFSTSLPKRLNRIQWNLTGSEISTSSTKFVFFGLIGKTRWLLWPIPQKGCTLYSGARYVALWASCSFKSCHRKEEDAIKGPENVVELEVQSPSRGVRKSQRTTPSKSSTCFGEPKSQPSPSSKIRTKCSSMIIMLGDKTSWL